MQTEKAVSLGNTAQFKAHGLLEDYSVSLPKKSRQGVSLTLIYLYNLTKNLAAQSAHLNYAVLPLFYQFDFAYRNGQHDSDCDAQQVILRIAGF